MLREGADRVEGIPPARQVRGQEVGALDEADDARVQGSGGFESLDLVEEGPVPVEERMEAVRPVKVSRRGREKEV